MRTGKKFTESLTTLPSILNMPIYEDKLVKLYGGKCQKKTLPEMNKAGWRLVQVVGGLNSAFGMVLEK